MILNAAPCCLYLILHQHFLLDHSQNIPNSSPPSAAYIYICVSKLFIIGSDNGLSPSRRQAITWFNAGLLSIELSGTNSSENWIWIQNISFKKMHFNMPSAKMASILSRGRWVKESNFSDHLICPIAFLYVVSGGHVIGECYIDLNCQEWCPRLLYMDKCHDIIFLY